MKEAIIKPAGVKEIAKRADVSIGTVDRVIHNRKGVSEETRQKVNAIIAELDFRPNKMASLLAKRNLVKIGVIIPKSLKNTDYWSHPSAGIEQAFSELKQFGLQAAYFHFDLDSKKSFVKASKQLLSSDVQGVLIAPSFIEESLSFTKKLGEQGIPFVFINSDLPRQASLSYIGPELYQSGRLAAQMIGLMIKPGESIFIVNISTELELEHHLLRKEQGFRAYFEESHLSNDIITHNISQIEPNAILRQLKKALTATPGARVLFVTNSRVHAVAAALKKQFPGLILVGYDFIEDNIPYLEDGSITFIISQRPKEQGYLGVMALYKHLFGVEVVEQTTYMPIDIITRENYRFYKN